jgi:hypothetical protein
VYSSDNLLSYLHTCDLMHVSIFLLLLVSCSYHNSTIRFHQSETEYHSAHRPLILVKKEIQGWFKIDLAVQVTSRLEFYIMNSDSPDFEAKENILPLLTSVG